MAKIGFTARDEKVEADDPAAVQVIDDAIDDIAIETKAREAVDESFELAQQQMKYMEEKYNELRGKPSINAGDIISVVKNNWKSITLVAAALGVPISISEPGAFASVATAIAGLWPF